MGAPPYGRLCYPLITLPKSRIFLVSCLDEAVVERQTVPYRVLPALSVVAVVGKLAGDELVDVRQGGHARRRALDRHRDQRDIRVRRLGAAVPRRRSPSRRVLLVGPDGRRRYHQLVVHATDHTAVVWPRKRVDRPVSVPCNI